MTNGLRKFTVGTLLVIYAAFSFPIFGHAATMTTHSMPMPMHEQMNGCDDMGQCMGTVGQVAEQACIDHCISAIQQFSEQTAPTLFALMIVLCMVAMAFALVRAIQVFVSSTYWRGNSLHLFTTIQLLE